MEVKIGLDRYLECLKYRLAIDRKVYLNNLEKEAKLKLKEMCPKDKWVGLEITADIQGNYIVFSTNI